MFTKVLIFLILEFLQEGSTDCEVASLTTVSGTHAPQGRICPGDLIFEDNFETLDLKKWQHEQTLTGGGSWEFQWYNNNRTNTYVEDGILHIKPTLLADERGDNFLYSGTLDLNGGSPADEYVYLQGDDPKCTNRQSYGCLRTGSSFNILNPIKSAKIRTVNSFSYKYGKTEIRAKIPSGDWLWPAVWMMSRDNPYSKWPASGEIDILESRGNLNLVDREGTNFGTQQITSTLHWGPNSDFERGEDYTQYKKNNKQGYHTDFHRYQLEWGPDEIVFSVDDKVTGTVAPREGGFWELGELYDTGLDNPWKRNSKMAPFDQEFYLIINLAVGGIIFFPDDATNAGGKPWSNTSPKAATDFWEGRKQWLPTWKMTGDDTHFQIDYVRIWAL